MKIEKEIEQILNEQITHEFEATYAYLGLSTALNDAGFPGFSHWMRKQYEEELTHAMKIIDYIQEPLSTLLLAENYPEGAAITATYKEGDDALTFGKRLP